MSSSFHSYPEIAISFLLVMDSIRFVTITGLNPQKVRLFTVLLAAGCSLQDNRLSAAVLSVKQLNAYAEAV
jgi:hypothetical protein